MNFLKDPDGNILAVLSTIEALPSNLNLENVMKVNSFNYISGTSAEVEITASKFSINTESINEILPAKDSI